MPSGFVLDASVLVARFRRSEPAHDKVRLLMLALAASGSALYAPAIALVEVAASLARRGASAGQVLEAVDHLRQFPSLTIVDVDEALGDLAASIAANQRLRGCDAVYVALAQMLEATLITLDDQQRERTPLLVVAQTPGEALATLT